MPDDQVTLPPGFSLVQPSDPDVKLPPGFKLTNAAPTTKLAEPERDVSQYDRPTLTPPALPLQDDPDKTYGTILPFAKNNRTGAVEWAFPEIIRAPVRGMIAGGQEARGLRPVNDPSVRQDITAAASLGAGFAPAATVASVTPSPAGIRPLYEFVSRIAGEDISKNPGALRIVKRMEQDQNAGGPTAQDMLDLLNLTPGKPLTAADVGGENTLALAGKVARTPGESRQVIKKWLDERDKGAGPRLDDDITRALGDEAGTDAFRVLVKARSAAAKPLFDKANEGGSIAPLETQFEQSFNEVSAAEKQANQAVSDALTQLTAARAKQPVTGGNVYSESAANQAVRAAEQNVQTARAHLADVRTQKEQVLDVLRQAQEDVATGKPGAVWNPRIQQFLDNPRVQQGIRRGLRIERDEATAAGRPMNPSEYAIVGTDANGDPIVGKVPTMRLLAVAKEGLDRMLQGDEFRNQMTGELNKEGVAIDKVRGAFLNELDRLNPDYKAARAQWSGDTQSLQAFQLGEKLFNTNPRVIQAAVADMTPNDKEFLRLGAARLLRDRVAQKGITGDEAKAILRSDYTRQQLRPIFDTDKQYERFVNGVEAEGRMFGTRYSVLGNSRTAAREAEDQSLETGALAHAARGVSNLASHSWLSAAGHGVQALKSIVSRREPQINAESARLLSADLSNPVTAARMQALRDSLANMPAPAGPRVEYANPDYRIAAPLLLGAIAGPQDQSRTP